MTNLAQHKQGEENRGKTHIIHNYILKKRGFSRKSRLLDSTCRTSLFWIKNKTFYLKSAFKE